MQITCPSCAIAYQVPEARMAGKRLRCSACLHVWTPQPPEPAEPASPPDSSGERLVWPDAEPARAPQARLAPASRPARRTLPWVLIGWAATLLIWGGAALAFIDCRAPIARIWPPSVRLYRALGMEVAPSIGPAHDIEAQDRRSDGPAAQH